MRTLPELSHVAGQPAGIAWTLCSRFCARDPPPSVAAYSYQRGPFWGSPPVPRELLPLAPRRPGSACSHTCAPRSPVGPGGGCPPPGTRRRAGLRGLGITASPGSAEPWGPSLTVPGAPPWWYSPWLSRSQGGPGWLLWSRLAAKLPWGEETLRVSGGSLPGTPTAGLAAAPRAHLAGGARAGGLSTDVAQDCAMPEPGVDQPPRGWLLPWDAVVVIMVSHLFVLSPG